VTPYYQQSNIIELVEGLEICQGLSHPVVITARTRQRRKHNIGRRIQGCLLVMVAVAVVVVVVVVVEMWRFGGRDGEHLLLVSFTYVMDVSCSSSALNV